PGPCGKRHRENADSGNLLGDALWHGRRQVRHPMDDQLRKADEQLEGRRHLRDVERPAARVSRSRAALRTRAHLPPPCPPLSVSFSWFWGRRACGGGPLVCGAFACGGCSCGTMACRCGNCMGGGAEAVRWTS